MQTVTQISDGKAVIRLSGRFDFDAHREFRSSCSACLDSNEIREVELDLGGVDYVDSSALGMLLLLRDRATAVHKNVSLSNSRGTVKQVLEIANFGKLFQIK